MRAIWSGAITFGLVNVPVKLCSATEDHDLQLHQVHAADGGRIRYERTCEMCARAVPYDRINVAYADDQDTIVLTEQDLSEIPQERDRDISVVEFVPAEQIDSMLFERSYYVEPTGTSVNAYVLLRRAIEKTERTAIVQFALRQKTRLGALRVRGDMLLLQTLLWPDEIRDAQFPALDRLVRISAKEMQLSAALVKSLSDDFEPERFRDEYREQLRKLIEAKRRQGDAFDIEETFGERETGAEVIDLVDALRQSVQRSRAARKRPASRKGTGREARAGSTSKAARS